jgi:type II secretory pathway pseudopilin PulG
LGELPLSNLLSKSKRSGLSLVELVVVMMLMGISAVPLLSLFNQALTNTVTDQVMTTMAYVGQMAMESMLSANFHDIIVGDTVNGDYWYAQNARADGTDINNFLYKFQYSCRVYAINPTYAGNLTDSAARIDRSGFARNSINGNYYLIKVTVTNTLLPNKTLDLYTIVTPAGQGL